jgi:predicted kinase
MLIVVSGLPGTGKSAVAVAVANALDAVHLSVDPLEDALIGAGFAQSWETGVAAYEVARVAAEQNLALGRTVVVDAVNDSEAARDTWRTARLRTREPLVFALLVVDDVEEHRRRLEQRARAFSHLPEPTWAEVCRRAGAYEPWDGPCLRVDATASIDAVSATILDALRTSTPRPGGPDRSPA